MLASFSILRWALTAAPAAPVSPPASPCPPTSPPSPPPSPMLDVMDPLVHSASRRLQFVPAEVFDTPLSKVIGLTLEVTPPQTYAVSELPLEKGSHGVVVMLGLLIGAQGRPRDVLRAIKFIQLRSLADLHQAAEESASACMAGAAVESTLALARGPDRATYAALVMPLLAIDLYRLLRRSALQTPVDAPPAQVQSALELRHDLALWSLEQLVVQLDETHGAAMIHGDIKPENVMLGHLPEGRGPGLWFVDWGASCTVEEGSLQRYPMGSAEYAAPEVLANRGLTPASDIWSLGALTLHVASNSNIFATPADHQPLPFAANRRAALARWCNAPMAWPQLQDRLDRLPRSLRALLTPMLHAEPAQRPTAIQLRERLLQCTRRASVRTRLNEFVRRHAEFDADLAERIRELDRAASLLPDVAGHAGARLSVAEAAALARANSRNRR